MSVIYRPYHLQIPGEPKMARAALFKDGPYKILSWPSGATPVCCLAARRATYGQ